MARFFGKFPKVESESKNKFENFLKNCQNFETEKRSDR